MFQGVTGGYKGLQLITGDYKGLHWFTRGYKGLRGVPRGYRGVTKDYNGLQGITRGYRKSFFLTRMSPGTFSWSNLYKTEKWNKSLILTKTMDLPFGKKKRILRSS